MSGYGRQDCAGRGRADVSDVTATTRRHRAWKGVTKRDTLSRSLSTHRATADEIGVRAYAKTLGLKPGTLSRYLAGNYTPKRLSIRRALGLIRPAARPRIWIRKPLNVRWPENTLD